VSDDSQQPTNIAIYINNAQENQNMSNIHQNHYGKGDNVAGNKTLNQFNHSQDLAKAAQDIKALLDQLSQDYPSDSQAMIGAKAIEQIEKKTNLKQRIVGALKEAGATALEEAVDHPAIKIVVAGARGFADS
jgi:internalin A